MIVVGLPDEVRGTSARLAELKDCPCEEHSGLDWFWIPLRQAACRKRDEASRGEKETRALEAAGIRESADWARRKNLWQACGCCQDAAQSGLTLYSLT